MIRFSLVLSLSASLVAVALAGFALLEVRSRDADRAPPESPETPELPRILTLLDTLQERVRQLEVGQQARPPSTAAGTRSRISGDAPPGRSVGLREQIETLSRRLSVLEDAETIARLAKRGEERVRANEIAEALEGLRRADASPERRLKAWKRLRRLRKSNRRLVASTMDERGLDERELVAPMLELAQDTRLDPNLRAEVVRNLVGTKIEEVRGPFLDLLAFDAVAEVREGALDALLYHLNDPAVRDAVTRASREDTEETVRSRAARYLPKVQFYDRRAAQAAGEAETDASAGRLEGK